MKALRAGRHHRSAGQSLVEFALILPLLVLMIMGIFDLGRGIFAYNTLAESARQANRLAIVDQDEGRVQDVAIAHAPALGLVAADVDVCFSDSASPGCGGSSCLGCLVSVTTRSTFVPITPIISAIVPSLSLSSTSVGPIEYVCPRSGNPDCP